MKKITIYIVLALLCLNFRVNAQHLQPVKPLAIGDTLPDILLSNLIHYKSTTAKLAAFKRKVILLDFWATWCSNCINGLPHMDSLQRQFGDKLQVFLINCKKTGDDLDKINALFKRIAFTPHLPVAVQDTTCSNYFRFTALPHYVWINQQGRIVAMTGKKEVTDANVSRLIASGRIDLPVKIDRVR
ncbi:thiol-disulfide isomerase/thioredoxin [Mucilaginibacter gracilis]|uniref:Thiol-disulfide isomerase/thioredoxin n=1 Tax=Mucilaginibacter gracilis TaxID=423350 RepID=A0A495J6S2_9SPHI|nr:TlpA disulfide reductase family protein [Mucilaginibacter gracilis]RKR84118.1 thiol-disulfide isomerase/thioredoxin [Mucilaginibacter gracilis]